MPVSPALLAFVTQALKPSSGSQGILSERERRELLDRIAVDADPSEAASSVLSTIAQRLRDGALDLSGTRRARLASLVSALELRGLLPDDLGAPDPGEDWVHLLARHGSGTPPGPAASPPPQAGLPLFSLDGLPVRVVGSTVVWDDRHLALHQALELLLALHGRPPSAWSAPAFLSWMLDGLLAAPPTGSGRVEAAASALVAASLLRQAGDHPAGRAGDLAAARATDPRPAVLAALSDPSPAPALRRLVDDALGPRPSVGGVSLLADEQRAVLGALALARDTAAAEAFASSLPRFAALSSAPGALDASTGTALVSAIREYLESSDAVTFTFGKWSDVVARAVGALTHARAVASLVGPSGSLRESLPHIAEITVPISAIPWLERALGLVRDAAALDRFVDGLRRAWALVPGAPDRPLSGTGLALLQRVAVQEESRAEASPDGRSDHHAFPEAVGNAAAAIAPGLRAWIAGISSPTPVVRTEDGRTLTVPPALVPLLRDLATERVGSDRSLPNLAAALAVFAGPEGLNADDADPASTGFSGFLHAYLARWPQLRTFDFNKLERMARAATSGNDTPLCRINGVEVDPGRFHAQVGLTVREALRAVPFPFSWIPHRFGYRARQAAELIDLLAERASQGRGPLAALWLIHPRQAVTVLATTSDMEYNALIYRVRTDSQSIVYYMDSAGAVHVHERQPEAKHLMFEADVDADGHLHVHVPPQLPLSPRAWPLMNTHGLGDRIDVEVYDGEGLESQTEQERFGTRYRVLRGTITAFDDMGNHRVIVDEPTGPVERVFTFDQIRGWNNPHVVPEVGGEACTMRFNRTTDRRFADDLAQSDRIAAEHGLPEFDMATSEVDLARRQKAWLKALTAWAGPTLRYPRHPPVDEADHAFEDRLSTGTHPAGEYLEIGRGVCRHQFIRAHMCKQRAGIDERFASGAANTYGGAFRGLHIWGEVSLADRSRLAVDNPEPADTRFLSDATWGDAYVPLWEGAYGNDLRRVEMYSRTKAYASLMVRSMG